MSDFEIVLPNLGFGMEEGRLLAWLKRPGDPVRKGEAIAEVESDKANVELEAVVDGVLDAILIPAEQIVPVGTVLARIRTGTVQAATTAVPEISERGQRASPVAQRLAREHGIDLAAVAGSGPEGRVTREDVQTMIDYLSKRPARPLTAPAVRKLARDRGIDLTTVRATGKEGHIRREDVEALLKAPLTVSAPAPTSIPVAAPPPLHMGDDPTRREIPLTPMRQAIARQLTQSVQDAPQFFTTAELDFTNAIAALPAGIGLNTLILYLCVQALRVQPELNATYEAGHLYHYDHVHLALAVALPDGLLAPVLHRADDYSLAGLAERSRDLIERARASKLKPDELAGGTFTISNLGMVKQVDRFTAIINAPQVGILAVGAAKPRPLVIDGGLHIRTTAHLTLSADHRVLDGMAAARFLEAFDQKLQTFSGS